ncbi:MAG: PD40 domain-containing protein [Ignavibacteriae bacterium]|nr:PD40 domain-containing protein [Ignavibacteriota bacterium]
MKIFAPTFILVLAIHAGALAQEAGSDDARLLRDGEKHLRNIRQLTFEGENAEAYLSFDETKLIFQSRLAGMECDQIYTMTIDGADRRRVSSGNGRTTCSYWLPDGEHIIYASTEGHAADCLPQPDKSKGYVWKLYPEFDIYRARSDGSEIQPLAVSDGYDAEATVSPNGDKIIFTSTRDGDPELYIMNIDGRNLTRLTHEPGYDGGAFFSPDGSKIVFRASRPRTEEEQAAYRELVNEHLVRPTNLEIFVMDADGSNMRQVTDNGAANFAPYMHPDGRRIIFCSNMDASNRRNFDLYMVSINGGEAERITFDGEFDGFPMFLRDGKHLVFCSNRNNKNPGDTNVFIAEWVD